MRLHSVVLVLLGWTAMRAAGFGWWAFDTLEPMNKNGIVCMTKHSYNAAIFRLYAANGDGAVDPIGLANIRTAVTTRVVLTEAYIEPSLTGAKSPIKQYREAMRALKDAGIKGSRIWLKVTAPYFWGRPHNRDANADFIRDFIDEGRLNGVNVGVFTNWYDWEQITHNTTRVEPPLIWYWQISGRGQNGNGDANFNDYVKFAAMPATPLLKQYGLGFWECTTVFNKNGYEDLPRDSAFSLLGDGAAEAQILRNNLAVIHQNSEPQIIAEQISGTEMGGTAPKANIFDTNADVSESELRCLKNAGYSVGAFRVYNRGSVTNNYRNVQRALSVGLNAELTVDPLVGSERRSAADQYKELIKTLRDANFRVRRLWLRVTNPFEWGTRTQTENVKFIREFIAAADRDHIYVGVYTNWYDWEQITANTKDLKPHSLWYWHANTDGRSDSNFGDFVSFGGLPQPLIKQFALNQVSCQVPLNVDLSWNGLRSLQNPQNGSDFIPFGDGVSVLQ